MKHTVLVNYVLYQTGWFACILGGAWHFPLTGLAIALGAIAAHLWLTRERAIEVRLIAIATAAGLLIEIFHLRTGTYRMTSGTIVENFPPPWMLALWAQFATTFRYSLRGIISRPALAGVVSHCCRRRPPASNVSRSAGALRCMHSPSLSVECRPRPGVRCTARRAYRQYPSM
jgi:hypothetical protein